MSTAQHKDDPDTLAALADRVAALEARVDAHDDFHAMSLIETAYLLRSHTRLKPAVRALREQAARQRRAFVQSDPFKPDSNNEDYQPGDDHYP